MTKGFKPPEQENTLRVGEIYKHYKGDSYEVIGIALHSNDDIWMVVYKPLYENPDSDLFTRPLSDWRNVVEWEGKEVERFTLQ